MDIFLSLAFTIIFSYLFGSLNSAIIVCRVLKHKDIRDYGSNNAGLTNVLRVFGKGPAAATLLCDLAKGVLAVVICRLVVTNGFGVTFFHDDKFIGYLAGFFCNAWTYFPGILWFSRWKGRSYCGNDPYRYRPTDLCFLGGCFRYRACGNKICVCRFYMRRCRISCFYAYRSAFYHQGRRRSCKHSYGNGYRSAYHLYAQT